MSQPTNQHKRPMPNPDLLFNDGTAHFGIRRFKKANKGNNRLIAMFKENVWKSKAASDRERRQAIWDKQEADRIASEEAAAKQAKKEAKNAKPSN